MNYKTVVAVFIIIFLASCAEKRIDPLISDELIMCTQDAIQCPNGSWVGRSGPKCEFACP